MSLDHSNDLNTYDYGHHWHFKISAPSNLWFSPWCYHPTLMLLWRMIHLFWLHRLCPKYKCISICWDHWWCGVHRHVWQACPIHIHENDLFHSIVKWPVNGMYSTLIAGLKPWQGMQGVQCQKSTQLSVIMNVLLSDDNQLNNVFGFTLF